MSVMELSKDTIYPKGTKLEVLKERFTKIGTYEDIEVFDTRHALEELKNWFPRVSVIQYQEILSKGIKYITHVYSGEIVGNYMIISKSLGVRIPIEIREDRYNKGLMIGAIPTTLAPHEVVNLRNEIELYVEKSGYSYRQFKLLEGFNYYTDKDKLVSDFEEVTVL